MNLLAIVIKNLCHQKIRTTLTILGIGISIAAFVSLRGLADNLEQSLQTTYKVRGSDLIVMEKATLDIFASSIDQKYITSLKSIPHVREATPCLIYFYAVKPKEYFMLFGWEMDSFLFEDLKITGESIQSDHDALLGFAAAKRMKKSVGDKIRIRGEDFQVCGIFSSPSLIEDGGIIVPLKTLQRIKKAQGKVTTISFRLDNRDSLKVDAAQRQEMTRYIQERISALFPDLEVKDMQDFASAPFTVVFSFTWAISVIVFLIVILGIVNTMTTAVLERRKEIGILLAIGWQKRRIVLMVILESAVYGFWGGMVGLLIGYGMMKVLATFPVIGGFIQWRFDLLIIVKTLALSLGVGCLAGIYPSVRAVSIQPVDILRHE
ncbi:MAG: ABC transporter permease [Candidatus Omnitrophota bacterium]